MISAIAAIDKNYAIGYKNELLYRCPEDMQYFKKLTLDRTVIMGRNTFESMNSKPLPERDNIVITSNPDKYYKLSYQHKNLKFVTLTNILKQLEDNKFSNDRNVFIIGGQRIYEELIDYCIDIYLTKYDYEFENSDAYFPRIVDIKYKPVEHIYSGIFNNHNITIDRYTKGIEKYKL